METVPVSRASRGLERPKPLASQRTTQARRTSRTKSESCAFNWDRHVHGAHVERTEHLLHHALDHGAHQNHLVLGGHVERFDWKSISKQRNRSALTAVIFLFESKQVLSLTEFFPHSTKLCPEATLLFDIKTSPDTLCGHDQPNSNERRCGKA